MIMFSVIENLGNRMKFPEFFRKKGSSVVESNGTNLPNITDPSIISSNFKNVDNNVNCINNQAFRSSMSIISEDSLEPGQTPTTPDSPSSLTNSLKRRAGLGGIGKKEIFFSDVPMTNLNSSIKAPSTKSGDSSKSSLDDNEYFNMVQKYKLFSIIYGMIIIVLGVILPIVETAMKFIVEYKQDADDIFEIVLFSLSIVWFVYCFFDINLFKRRRKLASAFDSQLYSHDTNRTTGGLYIKIGCGFFCMASLLQNGLLLAEAFEFRNFCGSPVVFVKNLLRFVFTFLQYAFLFKNSHVMIQSKLLATHLSISHIIVTNICVWFRFILEETFESVKSATDLNRLTNPSAINNQSRKFHATWRQNESNNSLGIFRPPGRKRYCTEVNTQVSDIIERLSPYLHPCVIEYSIICVTLFYIIWYNVGRRMNRGGQAEPHTRRFSLVAAQTQIFHVDCNKSAKGLFAGFLIALLTMITLIIFVVSGASNEATADNFKLLALYLSEAIELLLLLLCLLVALNGLISMRKMGLAHARPNFSMSLEVVLEIFALFGVLSFGIFRILSFRYTTTRTAFLYLFFINGILSFIQGLVQTVFILLGMEKRSMTGTELKRKKGREQISFLIILNLCLWLLYTVTRNKYAYNLFQEVLNSYGGSYEYMSEYVRTQQVGNSARSVAVTSVSSDNAQAVKWIIINTITYPLLLYFHFHSSCCLSIMWKLCYHFEVDSY